MKIGKATGRQWRLQGNRRGPRPKFWNGHLYFIYNQILHKVHKIKKKLVSHLSFSHRDKNNKINLITIL